MKVILPMILLFAACAGPAAPPPESHERCRASASTERTAHLTERFALLEELRGSLQDAFDRETDLEKKRAILARQQQVVQRMIETRDELRR